MLRKKTFMAKATSWLTKNKLYGPYAFLRFVMLVFVQRLNQVTDEFVFKGGNVLWLYIKTPRATVDADFVTRSLANHDDVKQKLEQACGRQDGEVQFSIESFNPIEQQAGRGAAVTIRYATPEGQKNTFDLDIVYALPTLSTQVKSPIAADEPISIVTVENIVADKLAACQRFKSGNTRMKDFDDLWRIAVFRPDPIKWESLKEVLNARGIKSMLDLKWINPAMEKSWSAHTKRNKGLPPSLNAAMEAVNACSPKDWAVKKLRKINLEGVKSEFTTKQQHRER